MPVAQIALHTTYYVIALILVKTSPVPLPFLHSAHSLLSLPSLPTLPSYYFIFITQVPLPACHYYLLTTTNKSIKGHQSPLLPLPLLKTRRFFFITRSRCLARSFITRSARFRFLVHRREPRHNKTYPIIPFSIGPQALSDVWFGLVWSGVDLYFPFNSCALSLSPVARPF